MTPLIFSPQYGLLTLGTIGYISLIAATTNAFNGALLPRRPDHYRHFTIMGIIILAYAGGIGGGIVRDILVNRVPSPLKNPGISSRALRQPLSRCSSILSPRSALRTVCFNS